MHAVQFSNLPRSDGSVLLSSGDGVVQASVYGPTEIKSAKELCNKAVLEVSFRPKVGQSDSEERLMEYFIRSALEPLVLTSLHPRTSINVLIQEVQDDGNVLACSVNAAYLALLDAGVPMAGSVAAIPIALSKDNCSPFPSAAEAKVARSVATICVESPGKKILGIKSVAFVSRQEFESCLDVARTSADDLFHFYREAASRRCGR